MSRDTARARIVETAAELLRTRGPAGLTTRAVAQAAGLQTPVIYRLFADKDALLDAVAEHVFARYVAGKLAEPPGDDPIADLRTAWDTHIGFSLENPALLTLYADPDRRARMPAATAGAGVLLTWVHRIAEIGRLRVPERRAAEMISAAGMGAVLTLLATDPDRRDPGLTDAMYDAVMRVILTDEPVLATDDVPAAVVAFQTLVPKLPTLTGTERALLTEWLQRSG
jgi:AcrR family transcriptional regulator